ncbi:uncharacterized protein F4822DRAFT_321635 [Hypoxylon trugodes]|uniref:uncharacterized protein n=1 Tax=Hypoxylon trugodes TaxID=326681 RepID=UPI00219266C8|nr:uncharacterized protein F4822DRAFT_321635 [Hypoxylon trugodes]KAI1386606.1 hypothetical protein F4822DRAFT_321635 [Hypoxylon trugodes]
MLTHAVCQPISKPRSLQTMAMARTASRPTSASLLKLGHTQQTRTFFRFGLWYSYVDPEFQRELRRRHHMLKHKYVASINRRLSWDQRSLDGHPRVVLKHMLRKYWNPTRATCGSRFVNQDELDARYRQSQSARDAASEFMRRPWSHHRRFAWMSSYGDHNPSRLDHSMWKRSWAHRTPWNITRSNRRTTESASTETHSDVQRKQAAAESFKTYRAQFSTLKPPKAEENTGPIHSDGPPPPSELKEYGQVSIDDALVNGADHTYDGLSTSGDNTAPPRHPIMESEEYALNHLPPEESDEQYDDSRRYQEYQRGELDELNEQVHDPTKEYKDLDKYKTYGASEAQDAAPEAPQDPAEMQRYNTYTYDEDTKVESQTEQYEDLGQYGPYKYQEAAKKDESSPKYDDLDKYKHYDDNGKPVDDSIPKYEDLDKYKTADLNDSFAEEQPFQQYGDLENYRKFKYQELENNETPERDIVAESLKEFDATVPSEPIIDPIESPSSSIANRLRNLDLDDTPYSTNSDSDSNSFSPSSASSNVQKPHLTTQDSDGRTAQSKLTGNYARDFPEDFSESWTPRTSNANPESEVELESNAPSERTAHIQAAEKEYSDRLSESTNSAQLETSLDRQQAEPKLEPALHRHDPEPTKSTFNHHSRTEAEVDPYSREPQGLETSYTKECDGEHIPPTFAKTYGNEEREVAPDYSLTQDDMQSVHQFDSFYHRDPEVDGRPPLSSLEPDSKTESSHIPEPTVYRILAYDPTMQKINTAETTSVVPDQASPLSPAEVLLRLSNPTKFFPHFAPLQAEGFEIVSGGGDVLVFRHVRPGKVPHQNKTTAVNPIDMMGKPTALPNAAAFVSPTGFVNYDMPQVEENPAPPFRSNIDVRREEPVFSGPKSTPEEARERSKKSLGKRALIGGAWVAGISYALGVVSEYFITGGADGRGPTGF